VASLLPLPHWGGYIAILGKQVNSLSVFWYYRILAQDLSNIEVAVERRCQRDDPRYIRPHKPITRQSERLARTMEAVLHRWGMSSPSWRGGAVLWGTDPPIHGVWIPHSWGTDPPLMGYDPPLMGYDPPLMGYLIDAIYVFAQLVVRNLFTCGRPLLFRRISQNKRNAADADKSSRCNQPNG
jgi:hypothetical protein